jgi:ribosomal-protein-alanine N-acetyltransferase
MFQVMTRDELFNYQTEKIAFEPLSMELLDSLHHYLSNEVVNKYIGWPLTKTMEESKVYLEELLKRHQSGKFKYVSVIDKKSKVHLGTGMLFGFDIEAKHVEVGYVIDQDQWGKGYGSDIVKLLKAYAFEHLKLNKMYARVVNINEASAKVLSKNGFELEATLKDYYKIDGQLRNCDYYSVYPIKD